MTESGDRGWARAEQVLDALIDCHMLLEPVRDDAGSVIDLRIVRVNPAALEFLGVGADMVLSHTVCGLWADVAPVLLRWGSTVAETGAPLSLDDEPFCDPELGSVRHVDVRAGLVGTEVSVTWRDVTDRHVDRLRLAASEARFRLVAENASGAVFSATADGVFQWVSPSVRDLLGWSPEEIVGQGPGDLVHADDAELLRMHMRRVSDGMTEDFQVRLQTRSGNHRWIGVSVRPVLDDGNQVVGRVGSWRDVTAEVDAVHALQDSRQRYRLLAENASDLVARADNNGVLQWFSDSIRSYGWEPSDVVGHPATEFIHPDDHHLLRDVAEQTSHGEVARVTWRIRSKEELPAWHWFRVDLRPVRDETGRVVGRVSGWQNIDAEVLAQQQLEAEGARLRATLDSLMDPHVLVSPVVGPEGVVVDLRYEWANERAHASIGAPEGTVVGSTVRELLGDERAEWTLEFIQLALESDEGVMADDVLLPGPPATGEHFLDVRASRVGDVVSLTWRDVTEAHRAMTGLADLAADSERRLAVFEPELATVTVGPQEARRIVADFLGTAVPSIALQPIVDVGAGGVVVGCEALARFPDDRLGGPDGWFTAAHRCGLGVRLERAALREAAAAIRRVPPEAFLSVNVSPQALAEGALDELAGIDPSRLVIELTEHVPVADYALVMAVLDPFRQAGCRVAIDDAGSGYASLRHVINLRPDIIKLDAAIVRGVQDDPLRQAVARMMIAFSRGIGAEIICEGVETDAELTVLRTLGATWMQGYLLGRPEL